MNRLLSILLACSCFLLSAESAKADQDCAARPTWCAAGYECRPIACAADNARVLDRLGKGLVALEAERPRWFRPFVEGGVTDSFAGQGLYGSGGVILWRHLVIEADLSKDAAQSHAQARIGFRREW